MRAWQKAAAVLCLFFISVFTIAFIFHPHYPLLVIAGESSVGTWMSGVLLITCAIISLLIGMKGSWWPWLPTTLFFFLLALDERFMFHEQLKERLVFSYHPTFGTSHLFYEIPVMVGALFGGLMTYLLWQHLRNCRPLLLSAALLGTLSVVFDITSASVLLEECFKLLGELMLAVALVKRTGASDDNNEARSNVKS
jgi:hypothetical protein